MAMLEDVLAKKTFKEDGLDVGRRVFYTLTGEQNDPNRKEVNAHRNSRAIAMLLKTLHASGTLTDAQLDEILLEVIS